MQYTMQNIQAGILAGGINSIRLYPDPEMTVDVDEPEDHAFLKTQLG